jgi:hypothetical protein
MKAFTALDDNFRMLDLVIRGFFNELFLIFNHQHAYLYILSSPFVYFIFLIIREAFDHLRECFDESSIRNSYDEVCARIDKLSSFEEKLEEFEKSLVSTSDDCSGFECFKFCLYVASPFILFFIIILCV